MNESEQDGRVRELNYLRKEWIRRQNVAVREKNIQQPALLRPRKSCYHQFTSNYRSDENFVKVTHRTWQLSDSCIKHSLDSAKQRVFLWILRFESSSKMTGSITYMFNILT